MTSSDEPEVISDLPVREDGEEYTSAQEMLTADEPVLGVLTGRYPARTMPIAPRQDLDGEFLDDESGST